MKRITVLLDGTWKSERDGVTPTNIVRLRRMLPQVATPEQMAPYYDPGVGTGAGFADRWLGGALGVGLSANVRDAYEYLAKNYRAAGNDRDEIYIFGFSRGAFTARSLAGLIGASGLLKAEECTEANVKAVWEFYRTPPEERSPARRDELAALCTPDVRIRFLGVFETVGALGIPLGLAGNWAGANDRFHDTKLGKMVDHAFHAVAIDEHRGPFVPTLWARPDHTANLAVQQVWFPGAHSDVGGGFDREKDIAAGRTPICDLSLDWMISRLRAFTGLIVDAPALAAQVQPGPPYDYLGLFLVNFVAPLYRLLQGTALKPSLLRPHFIFKLDPPAVSFQEFLHVGALDVLADASLDYLPPNLVSVVPLVRNGQLKVVGYDGAELDAGAVQARLAALPPAALAAG
jgi:hypothetical protein